MVLNCYWDLYIENIYILWDASRKLYRSNKDVDDATTHDDSAVIFECVFFVYNVNRYYAKYVNMFAFVGGGCVKECIYAISVLAASRLLVWSGYIYLCVRKTICCVQWEHKFSLIGSFVSLQFEQTTAATNSMEGEVLVCVSQQPRINSRAYTNKQHCLKCMFCAAIPAIQNIN